MSGFCCDCRSFRFCQRGLRTFHGYGKWTDIAGVKRCQFAFDSPDFGRNS